MLYDPKWEKPADVFSLESLIAWLEQQPSETVYWYTNQGRCLLSQYFAAMGFENPFVFSNGNFHHGPDQKQITYYPPRLDFIALEYPRTFGGALERTRKTRAA